MRDSLNILKDSDGSPSTPGLLLFSDPELPSLFQSKRTLRPIVGQCGGDHSLSGMAYKCLTFFFQFMF